MSLGSVALMYAVLLWLTCKRFSFVLYKLGLNFCAYLRQI